MTPAEHDFVARSYRPAVRGWVSSCVSARDTDDVTQEVFARLAKGYAKVEYARAEQWLRAVARSCVVDYARKRREVLSDPPEPTSAAPTPEDTLRSREMAAAVQAALGGVVVSRRRVLAAVAIEGRSVAEVAREEGIPESTAQSRVDQGARDLRAVMERQRAKEAHSNSGGFTSWAAMWAILDWRARVVAWMTRAKALLVKAWPKVLAFAGAVTGIGVIVAGLSGAPPAAPDVVVGLPAVAIDAPVLTSKVAVPMAPSGAVRSVAPARVVPALGLRRRHDAHAFFEEQRFGEKRP